MPLWRDLQHGLTGRGAWLQVADVVPETHPIRPGAETVPWAALVAAVARSVAQRFPRASTRGRPPISTRVWLAWERLHHEVACADAQSGNRWRTALAVMYAWGITEVQGARAQEQVVLPAGLAHVRRRLDAALQGRAERLQHDLQHVMRRVGCQCRGLGQGFGPRVRQTERPWLELGAQVQPLARAAQAVPPGKIVNAYAPPLAPMCTGKRNDPAPFGRTPGIIAEPAAGCLLARHRPVGHPSAAR